MSERLFDPTLVETTPGHLLGNRMIDHRGEEYMYVKADEALAASAVVVIASDYGASEIDGTSAKLGSRVAVCKTAIPSGSYGWACIYGKGNVEAKASCAADAQLYDSATAGHIDDAGASGDIAVNGMALSTARGSGDGTAPAVWSHPIVGATVS